MTACKCRSSKFSGLGNGRCEDANPSGNKTLTSGCKTLRNEPGNIYKFVSVQYQPEKKLEMVYGELAPQWRAEVADPNIRG